MIMKVKCLLNVMEYNKSEQLMFTLYINIHGIVSVLSWSVVYGTS